MRFEASVANCETYARLLLPDVQVRAFPSDNESDSYFYELPKFPPGTSHTLDWFDIPSIVNGICFGEGGPGQATIYVDRDRGIFYYRIAD